MEANVNLIYRGATTLISNLSKASHEKNYVLDPLTTLIRLAILSFKKEGTKISIDKNNITYNKPTIFQGTVRWSYGDNRNDLHNLFNPIQKAIEWYDISFVELRHIYNLAIEGLTNLQKSYSQNTIIYHTLDHYKQLLHTCLHKSSSYNSRGEEPSNGTQLSGSILKLDGNTEQTNRMVSPVESSDGESSPKIQSDTTSKKQQVENVSLNSYLEKHNRKYSDKIADIYHEESGVCKQLKELWNFRQLQTIHNLLKEIQESNDSIETKAYFNTINCLLEDKENRVGKIVTDLTTIL